MKSWLCAALCSVVALAGGCSTGSGGRAPGASDSGTQSCEGSCPQPGATCTIDPPPGSAAPSILCTCGANRTWCCADDGDCGAGGTGGAGSGGAGGSGGSGGSTQVNLDDLGTACSNGACPAGLTPVTYCGIAGCEPTFCSCEIECEQNANVCPTGSVCATVSDGPGTVCVKS